MADECVICQIIEGSVPSKKVYEDEEVLAFLDYNGAAPGHCFIVPKGHHPIMEQIPDPLVEKLFSIANKVSSILFDVLSIQGTNIFVTNGVSAGQTVAHFVINVIPRKEGDGINLQWEPRQLSEEEMSTIELTLKESAEQFSPSDSGEKKRPKRESISSGEENYLWKSVNRKVA